VREAAAECGREVAIMADMQGPKIRVGKFENGKINWPRATSSSSTPSGAKRRTGQPGARRPGLQGTAARRAPGDQLLLNDGLIVLVVDAWSAARSTPP
jgi:pyruvate kinase